MPFFYTMRTSPNDQQLMINLIPKNGCTTLANMLLQLDDISPPPYELLDRSVYFYTHSKIDVVHDYNVSWQPVKADITIAVKRDPVRRFLSFYRNRVLFHKELNNISINELQDNFHNYENELTVQEHALTQTHYGGEIKYYTHLYSMQEFDIIAELLSDTFNKKIVAPHLQQGGNEIDIELTSKQLDWIYEYYQEDYTNGWCE